MKKIVSLFPELDELEFEFWFPGPLDNGDVIPRDIKMALNLVKDWELEYACPKLISVSFIGGLMLRKRSSEWILG